VLLRPRPYPAAKYFGHSIWFLRDARLRGNLYNDYFLGGFAGFWLAPDIKTLVNGTLNVPIDTLRAVGSIAERRGQQPGESFTALLDRLGIDLFLGIRPPEVGHPVRPWAATTAHLEATPGWIPIFRSLTSAVYLRQNERNRENLGRVAAYFTEQRVPFDRDAGFDVEAVIRDAPDWAIAHGVVPRNFPKLLEWAQARPRSPATDRLAALYAALGLYDRALALDRTALRVEPGAVHARRRLVWSLLRTRRFEEAAEAGAILARHAPEDRLSLSIAHLARTAADREPAVADAAIARLPFLARSEVSWLLDDNVEPEPRRLHGSDGS
jgi:hypothetical protein